MGICGSKPERPEPTTIISAPNYQLINDRFRTFEELENGLRKAGLEACQLIVGIDFTRSNTWQGGPPYYANANLHAITSEPNPYQQVLRIMCFSLGAFDDDKLIDAYGFGDAYTTNQSVFSLNTTQNNGFTTDSPCHQLEGIMDRYNQIAPVVLMSGPTSFAPIIRKAIALVRERKSYHILLIIADGAVDDTDETIKAIIEASKYALSIVCIGVGKGPWDRMKQFDDVIPQRKFDNFQFVDFYQIMQHCECEEPEFAKHVMMEIPDQYSYIKKYILHYSD